MTEETKKHEEKKEEVVHAKPVETPKTEVKHEKKEEKKIEKEFVVPLRRKFKKTARYKRTPKAIRAIKEFLVQHMKIYDRDLNKIKIDKYLNEYIWTRGIKNPPSKIKIRAVVEGEFVRAELAEIPHSLSFKKAKLEKRGTKKPTQRKVEAVPMATEQKTDEEKNEEKEKKASVVQAGQQMEKAAAKQQKHQTKSPKQNKTQPRRMALQK